MKVKRKLVPNSYPLSEDRDVVSSNVSHHVYDANSNVSAKKQCLGDSNFISSATIGVTSSGIRNMTNTNSDGVPNTYIGQPITMPHHSSILPDTECKKLSHSIVFTNIMSKSKNMIEPNADVTDGGQPNSYCSWFSRQNPPVNDHSSSQHPLSSGPAPEYKY
ncbi:hypothetical protein Tco_1468708, partial [Tanacetum coccineum]